MVVFAHRGPYCSNDRHGTIATMKPLLTLFAMVVSTVFMALMFSMPSQREQSFLLAPGQAATTIALEKENETVKLLGASVPVRVTLIAPEGKVFKVNELASYTFTTQVGQRHNWIFALLNPTTGGEVGSTTFRMTTLSAPSSGQKTNEFRVRQGKHNTHVHSYYFYQAGPGQTNMLVNLGDYTTPGITYLHTHGPEAAFEVVLQAPPGEFFVWPERSAFFDDSMEGEKAPQGTKKQEQYRVHAGPTMQASRYWFVDANGNLYARSVAVQYAKVP